MSENICKCEHCSAAETIKAQATEIVELRSKCEAVINFVKHVAAQSKKSDQAFQAEVSALLEPPKPPQAPETTRAPRAQTTPRRRAGLRARVTAAATVKRARRG